MYWNQSEIGSVISYSGLWTHASAVASPLLSV